MQEESKAFQRQLRAHYAAIVAGSFETARHCLSLARVAQQAGDCNEVRKWMWSVQVLRMAAAEWRRRAERVAPMLVCVLWCLVGCAKASQPLREFTANFDVQPGPDGQSVIWSLHFTVPEYHAMLESTADGAERAKVRELIADGLRFHHMVGCPAREQTVTKLDNGEIAFVGSCPVAAHVVPAGGI